MNTNYEKWCNILSFQLHSKLSEILASWNSVCICNYYKALMQHKILCDWLMFWIVMLCIFFSLEYICFSTFKERVICTVIFFSFHYISCTLLYCFHKFCWESRFCCSQSASFYIWPFASAPRDNNASWVASVMSNSEQPYGL